MSAPRTNTQPRRRTPNDGGLATRLDAELTGRSRRREPRDSSLADERAQLLVETRKRRAEATSVPWGTEVAAPAASEPMSDREAHERRRLAAMLRARATHGADSHYSERQVEAQRRLIQRLAVEGDCAHVGTIGSASTLTAPGRTASRRSDAGAIV
jgi:hypothetical protein